MVFPLWMHLHFLASFSSSNWKRFLPSPFFVTWWKIAFIPSQIPFLNSNQPGLYGAVIFTAPFQCPQSCSAAQADAVDFWEGLKVNDFRFSALYSHHWFMHSFSESYRDLKIYLKERGIQNHLCYFDVIVIHSNVLPCWMYFYKTFSNHLTPWVLICLWAQ